ncbi:MAG: hypothetical protein HY645_04610 [Acidobacteria bacterium]|nr:hypothetical protein [Acidobacteriota bacterium]
MYRGKDIQNREKLIETCLRILQSGNQRELHKVLPHISIIRSPLFVTPLLQLLKTGDRNQKELAALALGSLEDVACIGPLYEVFMENASSVGGGSNYSLQAAIIAALGEIGNDAAIEPLLQIYHLHPKEDRFGLRRKKLVISALGALAQQGSKKAEEALSVFMEEKNASLRAHALGELSVAYWHRPNKIPQGVLDRIAALAEERSREVREAALSALSNLADLGCSRAERLFQAEE